MVIKNWVEELLEELDCEPMEGWSRGKKEEIIKRHCPFKPGTAYVEVGHVEKKLDEILAAIRTLRRAI